MIKISGNERAGVDGSSGRRHVAAIKRDLGETTEGFQKDFLAVARDAKVGSGNCHLVLGTTKMLGPSHKETTGSQRRWAEPCRSYRDVQKRVDCAAGGSDLARGRN